MRIELEQIQADGLFTPPIRRWTLEKYRLVWYYDMLFSKGMINMWENRIYIDLFSGAGHGRLEDTGEIYPSSALLALKIPVPFTGYVFCEKDPKCLDALRERVDRYHPNAAVRFVLGDCNETIEQILHAARDLALGHKQLTFCYVDPRGADFSFSTLTKLEAAFGRVDFLILLALWMDIRRNEGIYTDENNQRIDKLLGDRSWRPRWKEAKAKNGKFGRFVAEEFAGKMLHLRYLPAPKSQWKEISTSVKGLPLYHLLFFSKNKLGYKFWKDVLKYAADQGNLDLDIR